MRKSICLLLVVLLLSSCGTANETSPSPQNKESANADQGMRNNEVRPLSNDQAVNPQVTSDTGQSGTAQGESEIALKDHFEQLALRVPGVEGAHCVVMNNVAIVGLDVEGSLDRSRVGSIKYSVAEAIRKDPRHVRALVTADMDLSSRLGDMSRHISEGHPISGFTSELADIIGRIMPQLPEDTKPQQNTQ